MDGSNLRHNRNFYGNNLYTIDNVGETLDSEECKELKIKISPPSKSDSEQNSIQVDSSTKKLNSSDLNLNDNLSEHSLDENSSGEILNEENVEEKKDFNLKSTIAHLQGDLVYSVGVFISAIVINLYPKLLFFDSICIFLFSYVSLELTIPIFNESTRILLEGIPEGKLISSSNGDFCLENLYTNVLLFKKKLNSNYQ